MLLDERRDVIVLVLAEVNLADKVPQGIVCLANHVLESQVLENGVLGVFHSLELVGPQ
jgi:hypothetical protein